MSNVTPGGSVAWSKIPESEAKKHPLYGVSGWLLLFAVLLPLSPLALLGTLRGEAQALGMGLGELLAVDHPAITHVQVSLGVQTASVFIVLWLLVQKSPAFRVVSSWLLLGSFPVVMLAGMVNPFDGQFQGLAQAAISWAVSSAVWVTYLQRSQRVRVTFEHRVRTTQLDEQPAASPSLPIPNAAPFILAETPTAAAVFQVDAPGAASLIGSIDGASEEYWAQALQEVEGAERRPGLWARAFAHSKGVESVAKANYLETRVTELVQEHKAKMAEKARLLNQQAEEARIAALPEELRAFERLPKGTCPNCSTLQPLSSLECPKCKAIFGPDSAWTLVPVHSDSQVANFG